MRGLNVKEERLLRRAESRRRSAAHFRMRRAALHATQDFLDTLLADFPKLDSPRRLSLKIALRERQVVVEKSWAGLAPVIELMDEGHRQDVASLGLQTQRW